VVVAVGGGYGTLSEVGLALRVGRPVVSLGGWDLGDHLVAAGTPQAAVEAAVEAAFGLRGV
jgi:predicted Rossmann-fold nucleotide-binding protein